MEYQARKNDRTGSYLPLSEISIADLQVHIVGEQLCIVNDDALLIAALWCHWNYPGLLSR